MNNLEKSLENYLEIRKNLGHDLPTDRFILKDFILFMNKKKKSFITTKLTLEWAILPKNAQPARWAKRLQTVRTFARYLHIIDGKTEIPPSNLLRHSYKRGNPYIYSDIEIVKFLDACRKLWAPRGLRNHTYYCLFGLIAVAGLRINEAVSLDFKDVDLENKMITIRESKFKKSRLIPFDESTGQVLIKYSHLRNNYRPKFKTQTFFVSEQDTPITPNGSHKVFMKIAIKIGLRVSSSDNGARIHDMRHTFIVKTMIDWYKNNINIDNEMPILSAYVGHTKPSDTYWYISAVPELLNLAKSYMERKFGGFYERNL